jgi:hypothetical protein
MSYWVGFVFQREDMEMKTLQYPTDVSVVAAPR